MAIPASKGTNMSQDNNETVDSTNDTVEDTEKDLETSEQETVADTGEDTENLDELKEKLKRQTEQNQKLFERAKKAEGFEKQSDGTWVKVQKKPQAEPAKQSDDLSSRDTMALINAKITEDTDIDEVRDYARHKGITVSEALKTNVVKAILSERAEERQTANATNTGKTRTGQGSTSVENLLAKANKTGEIPDKPEDLDKLLEARYTPKSKN